MIKNVSIIKLLILFLISSLLLSPAFPQNKEQLKEEYYKGKADGEHDARASFRWVAKGFFFPVISNLSAILNKPDPPPEALVGKSRAYILGYTKGYQNKAAWKNLRNSCIGTSVCVVVSGVAVLIYAIAANWENNGCEESYEDCVECINFFF